MPSDPSESNSSSVSETPGFVARETELSRLQDYLAQAKAGRGRVAFVTGEAGAGKTTLVTEFARRAEKADDALLFLVGNCNAQTGRSDPYLPFREILTLLTGDVEEKVAQGALSAEGAQRLRKFVKFSGEALVEIAPLLISTLIPGAGAFISRIGMFAAEKLGWLDKLKNMSSRQEPVPTDISQEHIFAQYTAILQTLSAKRTLLIWLDDLHWIDPASAALLFHLGRALERSGVFIIGTYRQEDVALPHGGEPHPLLNIVNEFKRYWGEIQIDLDAARADDGRAFVDALLDTMPNDLDATFRQALFHHTGGHPLFTVELLRDLQERGELQRGEHGRWTTAAILDWNDLPARVEGVIEKRINRLDDELQEILTIASVEGEQFTAELVAQLQQIPARTLVRRLSREADRQHRLVQAQGSQQVGAQRLSRYQFRHNLIQKYLYHKLDDIERAYLHEDVAVKLEAMVADSSVTPENHLETLAYHYFAAALWPRALACARQAGEKAVAISAPQTAVDQFTRAIIAAEKLDDPALPALYRQRGQAFDTLGNFDRARRDYETAADLARANQDRQLLWQTMLDLGLLWASRDYEKTGAYCRDALALARLMDDPAALGHSLNRLGNWVMNKGEPQKALTYHQEALALFEKQDDRPGLAASLDLLAMTTGQIGELDRSAAYYRRAIPILRELNDRKTLASSLTNLASFTLEIEQIREAVRITRTLRWRAGEAYALQNLGYIQAIYGSYGDGLSNTMHGLQLAREIDHRLWESACRLGLGELFTELLAVTQARSHLETGLQLAREVGSRFFVNYAGTLLAPIYIQSGLLDQAAALLADFPRQPEITADLFWLKPVIQLTLARGDAGHAQQLLDAVRLPPRTDWQGRMQLFYGAILQMRAETALALQQPAAAESLLQELIEQYEAAGIKLGLWPIYFTLGQVQLQMGERQRAADTFQRLRAVVHLLAASLSDRSLHDAFLRRIGKKIPAGF